MRKHLILLALLVVLALINYGIFKKEDLRNNGELVYLELAPVDPRSIMQGDYMRLRFALAEQANAARQQQRKQSGTPVDENFGTGMLVLERDEQARAHFVRFHSAGTPLQPNERLFSYRAKGENGDVALFPDAYFFQEGHRQIYQGARFGMMRIGANGAHMLVGLADAQGEALEPGRQPSR